MQEEVDQKTIALAVKTGKLTAQVLQAAIRKYLAARQKGTGKAHHGQQSLRQLKKDGSALSNIEITDANIGLFKPCAKKYDIDFTLRKDRTTHPPRYIVVVRLTENLMKLSKVKADSLVVNACLSSVQMGYTKNSRNASSNAMEIADHTSNFLRVWFIPHLSCRRGHREAGSRFRPRRKY